jgi:hypothetical protein
MTCYYRYLMGIWLTPRTRTAALRLLWTSELGSYGTQPPVPLRGAQLVRYASATTCSARLLLPDSALGRKRARTHNSNFPNVKLILPGEGATLCL